MKRINCDEISSNLIKRLHRGDYPSCPSDDMESNKRPFIGLGNKKYQNEEFEKTITYLSRAFNTEVCNDISLAYMKLGKYELAIQRDPSNIKTMRRKIKVMLLLGRLQEANIEAMKMFKIGISREHELVLSGIFETLGDLFATKGRIESNECLCLDSLSNYTRSIILQQKSALYVKRAQIYLYLGRVLDALKECCKAIDIDPRNIDGRILKFQVMEVANADLDSLIKEARIIHGFESFEEIFYKLGFLYLKEAREKINSRELMANYVNLTKYIMYLPENAYVYKIRAHVSFYLHDFSSAFQDCCEAIRLGLDGRHIRAFRAKCTLNLYRSQEKLGDATEAYNLNPVFEYFNLIKGVRKVIKKHFKPKSLTFYDVLELDQSATHDDIRKQYLKLCLKYHPDKLVSASESQKLEGVEKFKRILECYNVLSDPTYRIEYDDSLRGKRDV